jgi:hypothetical protein
LQHGLKRSNGRANSPACSSAAPAQVGGFRLGFLLGGALMLLLATVGTAGYAAGQATSSAQDATAAFTPSTTVV